MVIPRVGLPVDAAQWGALALGVATLAWGVRARVRSERQERVVVGLLALVAALLSWGYVHVYLRGGPRIIDATSYWLEARGLAGGHVSWPVSEPESAALGRFLVRSEGEGGARAAVLFPPGYPLLLALGFLARAPLAVGPVLAAALVAATYGLGREVVRDDRRLAGVPLIAAALSVLCGALRYHTADTMSHGLAALCFTLATAFLLRARSGERPLSWAGLAGLFAGWLFATRPASGLAWAATALFVISSRLGPGGERPTGRAIAKLGAAVVAGALPFAIVFLLHQRLATGHWLVTTHAAHYATNDGPGGCFRYGFGAGIGCYGEHGDFVRANLPDGFGPIAALKTTARRLWQHLVDAGNAEPLALLVPAGAALAWRQVRVRAAAVAVGFQIAAYVPFYFDGNYPGGGARLYADVLPLEHVLLAIGAVVIAGRAGSWSAASEAERARRGVWIVALGLFGFAVRAGFDHAKLRDRDGGAPLFTPGDLDAAGVTRGLVLVTSDAAYNLAFDPGARAESGIEVARLKGDSVDTLAWLARGAPPAFVHRFEAPSGGGRGHARVEPYVPPPLWPMVLEGESLWPPGAQERGAYALPVHTGGSCASGGRALRLYRGALDGGGVRLGLPAASLHGATIDVDLLVAASPADSCGSPLAEVSVVIDGVESGHATVAAACGAGPICARILQASVPRGAREVDVVLTPLWARGGDPSGQPLVALDRIRARVTEAREPAKQGAKPAEGN